MLLADINLCTCMFSLLTAGRPPHASVTNKINDLAQQRWNYMYMYYISYIHVLYNKKVSRVQIFVNCNTCIWPYEVKFVGVNYHVLWIKIFAVLQGTMKTMKFLHPRNFLDVLYPSLVHVVIIAMVRNSVYEEFLFTKVWV